MTKDMMTKLASSSGLGVSKTGEVGEPDHLGL